jgi:hypothetical protein
MTADNAEGVLLIRDGCYALQAHLVYALIPSEARLMSRVHFCGGVKNPTALLADMIIFAATGNLPMAVQMFTVEKEGQDQ